MTMTSSSSSSTSLAPGFRFHPTDEELVRYYLRRKICGKLLRFDAISDIDVYKVEPWDLPDKSRLKSKDMEWYFFSGLDKKYGNSSRTNRATEKGYWKTTGKDRPVYHRSQVAGMKKTLVYHEGRAPSGKRTNWVMHEYRLSDESLTKAGIVQDAFVLCRIFQKSGAGPKNGAQYGAPLVEEEWENDDLEMTINMNGMMQIENGANSYLDELDLEQILGADVPPVEAPLLLEHSHGSNETIVENNSPVLTNGPQMDNANNYYVPPHQPENPILYETETGQVKPEEHLSDSTKSLGEAEFLFDDTFWDAAENLQYDNGAFLETNDMLNPLDDAANFDFDNMIDNYLSFHDPIDENLQYLASDPPIMLPNSEFPSRVEFFSAKDENEQDISNYGAPSSKQEPMKFVSETKYPFIKKASNMLGSIPAPHAFAAEYPTKKAALLLDSISQASSSVRVTAGLIERRGIDYNIFLSVGITPGKSMFKGWCYFTFLCVAVFSMSFKFGSLICTR